MLSTECNWLLSEYDSNETYQMSTLALYASLLTISGAILYGTKWRKLWVAKFQDMHWYNEPCITNRSSLKSQCKEELALTRRRIYSLLSKHITTHLLMTCANFDRMGYHNHFSLTAQNRISCRFHPVQQECWPPWCPVQKMNIALPFEN
jgi:hypothetical protein